jgi:murein DD-endopeptidase MepM/ murein hydrolase activator NlpD
MRAAETFKNLKVSQNSIKTNEIIEFQISASGDVTGLKKIINDGDSLILKGNSENGYEGRIIKANIVETEEHITAYIYSSLAATAHQQGVPYGIIDDLVDIFGNKIDFRRQVHPGDSFSVVYSKREFENGKDLTPGPVKAASIKIGNKMLIAVRHIDSHGKASYYDQNGEALGSGFLRYPLQFTRISSVFSDSRLHPVLKIKRPHHGVDFAAPVGTPVRAIGPGVLQIAGWHGGGGKTVKIKHNDRYSTAYLHLSTITPGLRVGSFVERGQLIGKVGMTGLTSGPHLHFSLYDNNRYVDPMKSELPSISPNGAIPVKYLNQQIEALKKAHYKIQLAKLGSERKVDNLG